jgi:hypothetical protein
MLKLYICIFFCYHFFGQRGYTILYIRARKAEDKGDRYYREDECLFIGNSGRSTLDCRGCFGCFSISPGEGYGGIISFTPNLHKFNEMEATA